MRIHRIVISFLILNSYLFIPTAANATLFPNPDGQRVYDTFLKVNWLANANFPGTKIGPDNLPFDGTLGVQGIDPNGAMSYDTAVIWVQTLNGLYGGDGYLGHNKWTIPRVPPSDPKCTVRTFGYNCMNSALGSLYYRSLPSGGGQFGFTYPDTTVPTPDNQVGPFRNFQPYLYWTSTAGNGSGQSTFSFNTGWQGSNHTFHYMYALPMIPRRVERPGVHYVKVGLNDLEVATDGEMVWDPDAVDPISGKKGVTWLADADLAKSQKFGLDKCRSHHRLCINADGSMKYGTAAQWIKNMNAFDNGSRNPGWLEQTDWELPAADPNGHCDFPTLHCTGGPMGELYFNELGLTQGTPVFQTPNGSVGPFFNLQPYLYWACAGPDPCQGPPPPNGNQSWSFSFGNGFQGTDIVANNLYVMVYYPQSLADALDEAIREELPTDPQVRSQLLSAAALISSTSTFSDLQQALSQFNSDVNAQLGTELTSAEVNYLSAMAQAAADDRGLQPAP